MNRRGFLKLAGQVGVLATLPTQIAMAAPSIDWSEYSLKLFEPVFDYNSWSWYVGGKLSRNIGGDWEEQVVNVAFLIDENHEVAQEIGVAEYGEQLIREQISSPEFIKKWLS